MNLFRVIISFVLLIASLSLLSFAMSSGSPAAFAGQFDPLNAIMNILYLLSYRWGINNALSVIIIIIGLFFVWWFYFWVIGKAFFRRVRKAGRY